MSFLRSLWHSIKLAAYFARYGSELLLHPPKTRREGAEWLHRFAANTLRDFDVQLTVEGSFPPRGALIANHQSYLDIVVLAALAPCVFCAKAEMEHWPVLGFMTDKTGTVYIDRGRGGSALKARTGMQEAAEAGLPVVFFPEGTTTNGEHMLPFHSGLLAQAMAVDEPIWAAYLHYSLAEDNGAETTVANQVAFWGDSPMLPHIFRFLGLRGVRARVRFAPAPIAFSADKLHRKQAAVEAREAVVRLSGAEDPLREEEEEPEEHEAHSAG